MPKVSPTVAEIEAMRTTVPPGPVVIVNLVKFQPGDGKANYARYMEASRPAIQNAGVEVLYAGKAGKDIADDEQWDIVILARYPSFDVFADFVTHPIYQSVAIPFRDKGLKKALFMVSQSIDLRAEFAS